MDGREATVMPADKTEDLPPLPLPAGVRQRFIDGINGLRVHLLEAGHETPGRPMVLLLHGFPPSLIVSVIQRKMLRLFWEFL